MSWMSELRQGFNRLQSGRHPRVDFADRSDTVGEIGREFNALAAGLEQGGANGLTREQAHSLRNRLAGILAALHVLKESGALTANEQATLSQTLAEARQLDPRLRVP